jgi:hypothetical protein
MELDNEETLVSMLTGLEALLIVSSRGGGRVVGLWRKQRHPRNGRKWLSFRDFHKAEGRMMAQRAALK